MAIDIRECTSADHEAIVELSLRAWAPVFASMEVVLGKELSRRLHGVDWRVYQARSVRDTLAAPANHCWVVDFQGRIAGFVVAGTADPDRLIGEVAMLAIDPVYQSQGLGRALTDYATEWLRQSGMHVAMIGTGGDDGHAAARRLYERAGDRLMPHALYFKVL